MGTHVGTNDVPNRVVFVFGGQGSQKPGMAAEFFQSSSTFRESLQASAQICHEFGYCDLLKYLVEGKHNTDASQDMIGSQLSLVSFELAIAAMWKAYRISPGAVIGNSLGEYAALCVAGVLSNVDALYLVYRRGLLLQEHCQANTHKMLVVTGPEIVRQVSQQIETQNSSCRVACFNSPRKVVVGGPEKDIGLLAVAMESDEVEIRTLPVPYAFHTNHIDPIAAQFRRISDQVALKTIKLPFGSTLLGSFLTPGRQIPVDYLARHACEPARFTKTLMDGLKSELISSSDIWLEIGPSVTCLSFVKDTLGANNDQLLYSCLPPRGAAHSQIGKNALNLFGGADNDQISS